MVFDKIAFLRKHLQYEEDHMEYEPKELQEMTAAAKEVFKEEKMLIRIKAPIKIFGDIHGQYRDMHQIFATAGRPDKTHYLFLGDYVDRGPHQLETICCLLAWKICYPYQFHMLRGNHETRNINRNYGFWDDLHQRFEVNEAIMLWNEFNALFDWMPVAALINNQILCMHGGVGPTLNSLDQITQIHRPLSDISKYPVAQDLLWADPCLGLSGFTRNTLRGVSYFFGEDVVNDVCKKLNLKLIVRAHQMMPNGHGFFCRRKLVTIFSAPNYYFPDQINMAAIMTLQANLAAGFTLFNPTKNFEEGENEFRQLFNENASTGWGYASRKNLKEPSAMDASTSMTRTC
uniref:Serine/threonine-protein phosphatase n=1 Tax=Acrobeloides nanus TaxID=290746 RepID=A0A914DKS8_9BILA